MKRLLFLFTVISILSCNEKHTESIVGIQFKDYRNLDQLAGFEKVSDTSFFDNDNGTALGLLHLKNDKKDLVIYARIQPDSENKRIYKVLDTLSLSRGEDERLTIGYCEIDLKNSSKGNLIALVKNTDNKNMFIKNIKDAWVANPNTKKIEELKNIDELDCFNETYDGEESKINYGELN